MAYTGDFATFGNLIHDELIKIFTIKHEINMGIIPPSICIIRTLEKVEKWFYHKLLTTF